MTPLYRKVFLTMSTNTFNASSPLDTVIGCFRSHLLSRALPEPVEVSIYTLSRRVSVKPDAAQSLVHTVENVLKWADTLTEVTASWWHTKEGDLIVTVHGRGAGDIRLMVFGAGPFDQCRDLVTLAPDHSEDIALVELYTLHSRLRDNPHAREVG